MKQKIILLTAALVSFNLAAQTTEQVDTTFKYNNRKVVVKESKDEINVSVYSQKGDGDYTENEKIYEGIFLDGKSVERAYETRLTISIPSYFMPKEKRQKYSRTHWAGFGFGYVQLPEKFDFNGEIASIINYGRSTQFRLNLFTLGITPNRSNFRFVVGGLGFEFNTLHLQNNKAIEIIDFETQIITNTEMTYDKSVLKYSQITFPIFIEKCFPSKRGSRVFINGGLVLKKKLSSSAKIWIADEGKKTQISTTGNLNLRPFSYEFILQIGKGDFGFFGTYSPKDLFLSGKGPKGNQFMIGAQFYF